jgi:hypothetical protein
MQGEYVMLNITLLKVLYEEITFNTKKNLLKLELKEILY